MEKMVSYQAKTFFCYNTKNRDKESQMEVIIFKNDASKSFLSVAHIGLCFYHSKQCFGKLVRALPHNLHFKWSTLVPWNKDKQAKNAQGKNTYTLHIFFCF